MKKMILAGLVTLTASFASAECFRTMQGHEPLQIGNLVLPSPAAQFCIQSQDSQKVTVTFQNSVGSEIAKFESRLIQMGRCPGFCQILEIESGQAVGTPMNPAGIQMEIQTQLNSQLQMLMGVLTIRAGRDFPARYNIISSSKNTQP